MNEYKAELSGLSAQTKLMPSGYKELQSSEPEVKETLEIPDQDDFYPGSFFRIPAPPMLGKTGWSLN